MLMYAYIYTCKWMAGHRPVEVLMELILLKTIKDRILWWAIIRQVLKGHVNKSIIISSTNSNERRILKEE